jgi:hypothetical protein
MKAWTLREWYHSHRGLKLIGCRRVYDFIPWYNLRSYSWHGWIPEAWYLLKCWFWHPYNVIKVRSLPPTWMDRDEVLLHANFQILCDYIEREKPFEHFDTEDSYSKDDWNEIRRLYKWWTVDRPARLERERAALDAWHDEFTRLGGMQSKPCEDNVHLSQLIFPDSPEENRLSAIHHNLEESALDEDDANLIALIKVRGHLWT